MVLTQWPCVWTFSGPLLWLISPYSQIGASSPALCMNLLWSQALSAILPHSLLGSSDPLSILIATLCVIPALHM